MSWRPRWPQYAECPRCGARVLKAKARDAKQGRPRVLDLPEILPASPDRSRQHRWWRRGTSYGKWRIALDADGCARALTHNEPHPEGHAIYRKHRCP